MMYENPNLKEIKVKAVVKHKLLNKSLLNRIFGLREEALIFCEFNDPMTGKKSRDYVNVSRREFDQIQRGDVFDIPAYYREKKPNKVYLRLEEAAMR